jgi:hypothetical protein
MENRGDELDFLPKIRENIGKMTILKSTIESAPSIISSSSEVAHGVVFQPQKLKEVVDIIDLMGNISSRVREDSSGDMGGGGGGQQGDDNTAGAGTSVRDQLIARAPVVSIMQKELVHHLYKEIHTLERQVKETRQKKGKGSAYIIAEMYKKIRKLSSLITEILYASTEMIRRFYIAVFIDKQPIVVSGGKLMKEE